MQRSRCGAAVLLLVLVTLPPVAAADPVCVEGDLIKPDCGPGEHSVVAILGANGEAHDTGEIAAWGVLHVCAEPIATVDACPDRTNALDANVTWRAASNSQSTGGEAAACASSDEALVAGRSGAATGLCVKDGRIYIDDCVPTELDPRP